MGEIERDEPRIKYNLNRLLDAKSDYDHLAWRATNAKAAMDRALRDLIAAGGVEEANRIFPGSSHAE